VVVRLKRVYDPAESSDGYRALIDRLWPRGVSCKRAQLDGWECELSPSTELRQWFGHEPSRFEEFRRRYGEELRPQRPRIAELRRRAREGTLTLVYSAHDVEHRRRRSRGRLATRTAEARKQPRPRAWINEAPALINALEEGGHSLGISTACRLPARARHRPSSARTRTPTRGDLVGTTRCSLD
jgi:uncharacterized protein YeaO (DUF488 family)